MSTIRIRHVDRFVDRHGKARFYYRPPGGKRTPLPGAFASAEFLAGYQKALAGDTPEKRRNAQAATGTIGHLIADYFASPEFLRMSKGTQRAYRHVIDRWVRDDNVGHRPVANMKREHVKAMIARRAATPGAANDLLKKIRLLMNFAIDANLRMDNPATRIKRFKGGAHHTWTEEEIGRFERRWPVGSKERIAFAFLLYTGQRRSDVVRMSWRDVEDDVIRVVQQKTGAKVWIPIHPTRRELLLGRGQGLRNARSGARATTSSDQLPKGTSWGRAPRERDRPEALRPLRPGTAGRGRAGTKFPNSNGRVGKSGEKTSEINGNVPGWRALGEFEPLSPP